MRPAHRRVLSLVVVAVVCVAGMVALWPAKLGGVTTYVSTRGNSMEPGFQQGDLALLRPADGYRVGDVVAYRSDMLDTVVMHRIVEATGGRFTLQGDNNTWLDVDHPDRSQIIGKLWARVPNGGAAVDPRVLGPVALGLVTLAGGVLGHRRRNRSGRTSRMTTDSHRTAHTSRIVVLALSAAAVATAAVAAYSFTVPTERGDATPVPFEHRVAVAYEAHGADPAVYEHGEVRTGDPVFLKLVDEIDVTVRYELGAEGNADAAGSMQVQAEISDGRGWSHRIDLGDPVQLSDGIGEVAATLDLPDIRAHLGKVAALTGVVPGSHKLEVVTRIEADGALSGAPLSIDHTARVPFELTQFELHPAGDLTDISAASVIVPSSVANELSLVGLAAPVSTVRPTAGVFALVSAAGAAVALRRLRRELPGEAGRIALRHGHRLVPITTSEAGEHLLTVEVDSIEDLMRLADQHGSLVLHHRGAGSDAYLFQVDRIVYRYQTTRPTAHMAVVS